MACGAALGYSFHAVNVVALVAFVIWIATDEQLPGATAILWIQLGALLAINGLVFIGRAFILALGQIGKVSTRMYIQIPIAVVLGLAIFWDFLPLSSFIGILLILIAGASIQLREAKTTAQG